MASSYESTIWTERTYLETCWMQLGRFYYLHGFPFSINYSSDFDCSTLEIKLGGRNYIVSKWIWPKLSHSILERLPKLFGIGQVMLLSSTEKITRLDTLAINGGNGLEKVWEGWSPNLIEAVLIIV